MPDRITGVYTIRNTRTGAVYVGSSSHMVQRWQLHRRALDTGRGASRTLLADWQAHGAAAFTFAVVEVVAAGVNSLALAVAEQRWIDRYRGDGVTLYNCLPASPHVVVGAIKPDGFVSPNEANWWLRCKGSQANAYRLIGDGQLVVHRFPEHGNGRSRFVAVAELEAFIATKRERRAA